MLKERQVSVLSGAFGLMVTIGLFIAAIYVGVGAVSESHPLLLLTIAVPLMLLGFFSAAGLFTVQPNQAVVLILFGSYVGTVRRSGWWWTNAFNTRKRVTLRVRSLNGNTIKVNDHAGNPVEIAAVVVWKVLDTAQATFDVESYEDFVTVQSETAVRHLASA